MANQDDLGRSPSGLEENLKKALTEMLILAIFSKRDYFIGELAGEIQRISKGALSIVFPYGVIYRMSKAGYVSESKKCTAPDGRLRQYYRITESGRDYLLQLVDVYNRFSMGVDNIIQDTVGGYDKGLE